MSTYFLLFLQGLISFVSPCVLPMVPVYLIYLAANEKQRFNRRFLNLLGFILGLSLIFVSLGLTANGLAQFIMLNRKLYTKITGILVMLLGIYYLAYEQLMRSKLKRKLDFFLIALGWKKDQAVSGKLYEKTLQDPEKVHFWGAFLFGIAFSLTSSPCISPNLSYALLLAANSDTIWQGAILLFLYSMGLGLPFMLVGLAANYLKGSINFLKAHGNILQKIAAFLMIAVGFSMFNGNLNYYMHHLKDLFA